MNPKFVDSWNKLSEAQTKSEAEAAWKSLFQTEGAELPDWMLEDLMKDWQQSSSQASTSA